MTQGVIQFMTVCHDERGRTRRHPSRALFGRVHTHDFNIVCIRNECSLIGSAIDDSQAKWQLCRYGGDGLTDMTGTKQKQTHTGVGERLKMCASCTRYSPIVCDDPRCGSRLIWLEKYAVLVVSYPHRFSGLRQPVSCRQIQGLEHQCDVTTTTLPEVRAQCTMQ